MGVVQYGKMDLGSIRAHYLPTKNCETILNRINNVVYRKQSHTKIKSFLLSPFKPMNESEIQILCIVLYFLLNLGGKKVWCLFSAT